MLPLTRRIYAVVTIGILTIEQLCALGTIGAAATGLVFAINNTEPYLLRPGKRKWPGASGQTRPIQSFPPIIPRRSVSQPVTPILTSDASAFSSQSFQPKRFSSAPKPVSNVRDEILLQDEPPSRDSSKSRRSILRPKTANSRTTTEKRGSSTNSSWLKRLSSFSSRASSPAPSIQFNEHDDAGLPAVFSQRPQTSASSMPNKLVKRSVSQRGVSHDEAQGQLFRRPATSHSRSQTFKDILARPVSQEADETESGTLSPLPQLSESLTSVWRPYFESGFPRKRRRSESATDAGQIRTISMSTTTTPIMLRASDLDGFSPVDTYERPAPELHTASAPSTTTRKSRRSLSSIHKGTRRRNFTDPLTQLSHTFPTGVLSPVQAQGVIAPAAEFAVINDQLASDPPHFASSPPYHHYERGHPQPVRESISASDPPTTSSDADGQVFSDQESIEFQSDTAYDSIATRATNGSGSAPKESRLETIFAARTSDEADTCSDIWQSLNRGSNDTDCEMLDPGFDHEETNLRGIGIAITNDKHMSGATTPPGVLLATPPRSASPHLEDFTPVPRKSTRAQLDSSPPYLPVTNLAKDYEHVSDMLEDMSLDDDEDVDWSADGDSFAQELHDPGMKMIVSSPGDATEEIISRFQEPEPELQNRNANGKMHKPSIFDWSDQQPNNSSTRPKTVHGKQGNVDRSRSSGRRGPPQLHFRSHSVPVNRDTSQEELPTVSKYKTWRLGAKPVSEEWSDDFEFDDVEEEIVSPPQAVNFRDSVRSVRIPQAIIDRQPSVHLQFGQVQEFMALVEELKRLRASGAALHILGGSAKNLWEDADSIINLATINDDDEAPLASSPISSDPFAELPPLPINTASNGVSGTRGRRPTTSGRRSVSAVTTPPVHGRARGESLAHARHFLQVLHQNRGPESSPREIEIHHQKKLPFDTQDLKDLVVRSGVITRALKEEVRKAEGVSVSPCKTPQSKREDKRDDPFSESFWKPEPRESSPSPALRSKPGLPKSRSAHSYLESAASRQDLGPFSSPVSLATVV